jgi:hypothetical protein
MRRGRLGHFIAALLAILLGVSAVNDLLLSQSIFEKAVSAAVVAGLLFILVETLRLGFAKERPASVLLLLGVGRPRRLREWIPAAFEEFLDPEEMLEAAALVSSGRWRQPRFLALTDRRLLALKLMIFVPTRIDFAESRADLVLVAQSPWLFGGWKLVIDRGDGRLSQLLFSKRFTPAARQIAEALSSSDRA